MARHGLSCCFVRLQRSGGGAPPFGLSTASPRRFVCFLFEVLHFLLRAVQEMDLLALLRKLKRPEKEARLLVLGLDNAGKTCLVRAMPGDSEKRLLSLHDVEPTQGFNVEKVVTKEGFNIHVWDIGGRSDIRPY